MKLWQRAAVAAALVLLFLVANRGAYQGYFSGDDLDNIRWTGFVPVQDYLTGLLSPRYLPNNFRPVGHGFYRMMGSWAGLEFQPWVQAVHVLHGLNCLLLWLLMRRLKIGGLAAVGGLLFFAFHPVVFDTLWKPMFVFDVFFTLFSLLCVLAWTHGRWLASFVFFWLAFKSKELAVALPVVLLAYEWLPGGRRWKWLLPFFAVSVSFGVQALLANKGLAGGDYAMSFAPAALWKTVSFYATRLMPFAWLGAALVLVPVLVRDRRVWWGCAGFVLMLAPVLPLPARTFGAYLYGPFALLAVALGAALLRPPWPVAAVFLAAWLPVSYAQLREYRRAELTHAAENRRYLATLRAERERIQGVRTFVYDGYPEQLNWWGVQAALRWALDYDDLRVMPIQNPASREAFRGDNVAVLSWDLDLRRLSVVARRPGELPASYIEMGPGTPIWQLEEGWYQLEHGYRWTQPRALAWLHRPAAAERFEIYVNVGPVHIGDVKRSVVEVYLDGLWLGTAEFTEAGWQRRSWPLPPGAEGVVTVELRASPEYLPDENNPRPLGVALGGLGFRGRD